MTTIVGVMNSQGIAIATDSAVTVTAGNIKKVYNTSNKLFTLSKYQPVGIAIYGSAQFMGIPWETLIKIYRKQLKDKKFDTIEKYKFDFISFLSKNIDFIGTEFLENNFYTFCSSGYNEIKEKISATISSNESVTSAMSEQDANNHISPFLSQSLLDYKSTIEKLPKNNFVQFSLQDYISKNDKFLNEIVKKLQEEVRIKFITFSFNVADVDVIKEIFYDLIKVEYIFEQNSGLVFFGFGEKEIYPSGHLITVGSVINGVIRYKMENPIAILPGKLDAEIISYAQRDVTLTVLTGIDPTYKNETTNSITEAFKSVSDEVALKISDPTEATKTSEAIKNISDTLIQKLDNYRNETITRPLINVLNHMGKEDMAEMAESLVSITSLKRKFTQNSSDESVGGPVDVAVVTKGDGFIWLKRKNYFNIELNRGFIDKYYKS